MENDPRAREAIEQMVRQETDRMVLETRGLVREVVRDTLLPQLRATIRDSISEVLQEVLAEEIPPVKDDMFGEISGVTPAFPQEKIQEVAPVPKDAMSEEIAGIGPVFSPEEMERILAAREEPAIEETKGGSNGSGRYVYCIADSGAAASLGHMGIENREVYTIPCAEVCAVVHNCSTQPYQSEDEEAVKEWVQAHQKVVDAATERFGTVLPLGFDTIVKGTDEAGPEKAVEDWLRDDLDKLKEKMDRVRGKQEFGVQVFYDPKAMGERLGREDEEIRRLKEETAAQKPGMAYMYKQKVEKAVKEAMEKKAEERFKEFYGLIKKQVDDIKVEKLKRDKGKTMLMNLSCLVPKDRAEDLGNELERIDGMEGFSIRFTGPWSPYSFV
ncbi:MAG: GvpL/GvpF family gas vesicle protein [Chloroflexi bacterium]|nr:GvpL/GvpF family gas vesicle protein [Chloroflexota bacterium]